MDEWLRQRAMKSEGLTARTYVACLGPRVIGYHCLAAGAVLRDQLPNARMRRNTPEQVPVIILGRLAVDREFQKRGLGVGKGLLQDAILRAVSASQSIGLRAILAHALDDDAIGFYAKYGFLPCPVDYRTLFLPIETAISALPK